MAIEINNYESKQGITIKHASLSVTSLVYYPKFKRVEFLAGVFAKEESTSPIEENVISGYLDVEDSSNLEELIEEAIQTKIDNIVGKSGEECDEHNTQATSWIDLWEPWYAKFISSDSSEEDDDTDDYVEAARILLGE